MDNGTVRRLGGYFGIAAIVVYVFCSAASALQFPGSFSPLSSWISDLGSGQLNPDGAVVYNAGSALTGLLLVPFFAGFAAWYRGGGAHKYTYFAAGLAGLALSLGLVMLGIFPEDAGGSHVAWAIWTFSALDAFVLLASLALIRHRQFNRVIAYYGFAVVLVISAFSLLSIAGIVVVALEWLSVYTGLLWMLLFSYNALSLTRPVKIPPLETKAPEVPRVPEVPRHKKM